MSAVAVHRAYVGLDDRQVHLRHAGRGAPIVLLHESPRSSASLEELLAALSPYGFAIAPDTPGYGLSDPLPAEPTGIGDYAAAVLELLDRLGIDRFALYGTHTGAAIAAEVALTAPARVAQLLLDGFPLFSNDERDDIVSRYLTPFEPVWDGSHLASLWSRTRDLYRYFPWYRHTANALLGGGEPQPAAVRRTVQGFMEAGPAYHRAYRFAFLYDGHAALARLAVPTCIMARSSDLLSPHLARVRRDDELLRVRPVADDEWLAGAVDVLRGGLATLDPAPAPPAASQAGGADGRVILPTAAGHVHARVRGRAGRPPLVLCHDIPGSGADFSHDLDRLAERYRVLAIDLPGCGDSSSPAAAGDDAPLLAEVAVEQTRQALAAAGALPCYLYGQGLGGVFAGVFAARHANDVTRSITDAGCLFRALPRDDIAALAAALRPRRDGSDLWSAWYRIRERVEQAVLAGPDEAAGVERTVVRRTQRIVASLAKNPDALRLLQALATIAGVPDIAAGGPDDALQRL